ncbi:MAG TPA: hypothetical protein VJP85_11050 [Candidatus Baltobacteraceae bacterium]|nr:hypothetical protein [Candidatus Baltobacteraceae bacterium]
MKLLSELLGKSKMQLPLTTKQYVSARDAGFTMQELEGKGSLWYSEHRDEVTYKADDPLKPRHIAVLKAEGYEIDVEGVTYYDGRKAMRELAKAKGEDKRYLDAIAAYEKDLANRPLRKRAQKEEQEQDLTEAQVIWKHYRAEYKRKFGTATVEAADENLVERIIGVLEKIGLEHLKAAISYSVHEHDHGKFGVSLRDLLSREWLLNICVQNSTDSSSNRRKAQDAGLSQVEYERAVRRGDVQEAGPDLATLRDQALKLFGLVFKKRGLQGAERRNFIQRPEYHEIFKPAAEGQADEAYILAAMRLLEDELAAIE